MSLRVYDTRRREKLAFTPLTPGRVGMYVCGMTVQDKPHVGHMRYAVAGDVMRRYLESKGYEVIYITNFTDIDDRIIDRANKEGVAHQEVSERNIEAFLRYAAVLNIKSATHYPRATEHLPEIIALIQRLIDKGHAYAASGDVYFDVRSYPRYGELSGRNVDDMRAGVRIDVGEAKRDPLDFALWKGTKPGEPSWSSPWGPGRPGWHIECSAMAMKYLGETFDFHGGGQDLVFPHHENEIAQSEAATGKPFARYWVENGLVLLGGAKMSKSTQHFFLIEDIAQQVEPEVIRFYLQSTHYRSPIEWNEDRLKEAGIAHGRLRAALAAAERTDAPAGESRDLEALQTREPALTVLALAREFEEAMDDDFNTARAQGHLFEMAKAINRAVDAGPPTDLDREAIVYSGEVLRASGVTIGLFWGAEVPEEDATEEVQLLARQRDEARLQKDWKRADELRDRILALGYVLEDQKGGTRARRKP
ncbi:MAG TPA: cysteine--tRNA ligase [Thermoplasmata archaeon]|nr:cysteine--tRNA ligase [Thermoplasmata archaeon]